MAKKFFTISDFPDALSSFDYLLNTLSPDSIAAFGDKKVWWRCDKSHSYETTAYNKTRKSSGCPYCSNRKILKGYNDLETTHPNLVKDWDYSKNNFTPDNVVAGANKKVHWKCNECSYIWTSSVAHRGTRNHSCPMCINRAVRSGLNDVLTTHPFIKELWDFNKNTINPKEISRGSNNEVWWICSMGHSSKSNINKLCNAISCSYCIRQKLLPGFNDIATVRPDLALQWDSNKNGTEASEILISSKKKYFWICNNGHSSFNSPFNRDNSVHSFCKECNPVGGFDNNSEGIFYFIHNKEYCSYKVGITNKNSKRLKYFQSEGWSILYSYTNSDGAMIRNIETEMLRWIRKDLNLPIFLGKNELGFLEGYTETFSDEIEEIKIIKKIESILHFYAVNSQVKTRYRK